MAKISELKAVVEGLTSGKWVYDSYSTIFAETGAVCRVPIHSGDTATQQGKCDAIAIAALRNHADALIELVEACISVLNQLDVVKNRYAIKELENALQKLENI